MNENSETTQLSSGKNILEEIDGIGPGYAKTLNKIDVHSFAELASFDSPDNLHQTLLDKIGVDVPVWKISRFDWIGQAKAKAAEQQPNTERENPNEETETTTKLAGVPSEEKLREKHADDLEPIKVNVPNQQPGWNQHAGFSVFFDYKLLDEDEKLWQTRVYHAESGVEEPFPGIATQPWVAWIGEKTQLQLTESVEHWTFPVQSKSDLLSDSLPEESDDGFLWNFYLYGIEVKPPTNPYDAQIETLEIDTSFAGDVDNAKLNIRVTGAEAKKLLDDTKFLRDLTYFHFLNEILAERSEAKTQPKIEAELPVDSTSPEVDVVKVEEELIAENVTEGEEESHTELNRLEILQMQVSEVGPSSATPEKQLVAEVTFKLLGLDAEGTSVIRPPYRIEIHTVNLESGKSNLVSSAGGQLRPQMFEYTNRLQFALPEVGRYRIYCVVLLLPPGDVSAYQEGPILNIV